MAAKRSSTLATAIRRVINIFKRRKWQAAVVERTEEQERHFLTRRFTNWQLTQWGYAGCPRGIEAVRKFSTLQKGG